MKKRLALVAVVLMAIGGCSTFKGSTASNQTAKSQEAPNAVFYSFPDIPVPKELSLVREKSFIYETPSMKVGVLLLRGNVDVASLEGYFKASMAKNGWRFVNSFTYNDMILNFVKDDRASNIRTIRESFTTQVEIWVGPVEKGAPPTMGSRINDGR